MTREQGMRADESSGALWIEGGPFCVPSASGGHLRLSRERHGEMSSRGINEGPQGDPCGPGMPENSLSLEARTNHACRLCANLDFSVALPPPFLLGPSQASLLTPPLSFLGTF